MPPYLVQGNNRIKIKMKNFPFKVGRSLDNDVIMEDTKVSRVHCVIAKEGAKFTLTDKSSNGVLLNGHSILKGQPIEISTSDKINVTDEIVYTFYENTPPESFGADEVEYVDLSETSSPKKRKTEVPAAIETSPNIQKHSPEDGTSSQLHNNSVLEELTCSICSEYFINPIVLNCEHSFCEYCLNAWRKNKTTCPICRKRISNAAKSLVLANVIEKLLTKMSPVELEIRQKAINERSQIMEKSKRKPNKSAAAAAHQPSRRSSRVNGANAATGRATRAQIAIQIVSSDSSDDDLSINEVDFLDDEWDTEYSLTFSSFP